MKRYLWLLILIPTLSYAQTKYDKIDERKAQVTYTKQEVVNMDELLLKKADIERQLSNIEQSYISKKESLIADLQIINQVIDGLKEIGISEIAVQPVPLEDIPVEEGNGGVLIGGNLNWNDLDVIR